MTFIEIALGHANTDWEFNSGIKPLSFDPCLWGWHLGAHGQRGSQDVGLLQPVQRDHSI